MYKFKREKQISFTDFNQSQGMQMNPNNRWVKKAAMIPWETIEAEYAKLFPSHTGMPAKPLRMALGSLLIQNNIAFPMKSWLNRSEKTRTISISSACPDMRTRFRLCRLCSLNFASVCLKRC